MTIATRTDTASRLCRSMADYIVDRYEPTPQTWRGVHGADQDFLFALQAYREGTITYEALSASAGVLLAAWREHAKRKRRPPVVIVYDGG
jgi:hypothetical protein